LLDAVLGVIPQSEYEGIAAAIKKAVKAIYRYQNSVMGVLDIISNDYENTNLDVIEIGEKLKNLDNVDLIKDVLTKIG
jgi:archaellum component FlaF (FlaF/FlaG flagellin family)